MAAPVVYFVGRGHLPISRSLLFASLALWGCRSQAPAAASSQQQTPQKVSQLQILARSPGVAIRLPAKGGTPQLYRLPRLSAVDGVLKGRLPPVERVVGLDPESEYLFVTTAKHELLALDLGSGRVDTVGTTIRQAALGPDGTLYAVDSARHVVSLSRRTRFAWPTALTALPRDLFGAADQHLVGVIPQDRLLVAAADQPPTVRPIAAGGDVAATRWGDLVAVASDSGVTFYDPLGRRDPSFVKLADAPRALAFSPSGHRIYVARRNLPGLAVVDPYDRKELDGVALPGPVAALRLDPLGRWLLARPAVGDSAWIVDLPIKRHTGIVPTPWQPDLPAISPDGMLIYRRGNDVLSVRPDSLSDVGTVAGGAADLWVLTTWLPRGVPATTASAAADSGGAGAEGPLYVQVSTSQNPEWSGHLADDLTRAGMAARVLAPQHPDDGYRVVLGPFTTRAQAEATGRRLGRPFWIYQPGQ
jgi:SPOR domain